MALGGWGVRVIAASAIAVLVTGCIGDPEPVVLPTLTVEPPVLESPTPEPTPSPSPTELTEEEVLAAIPGSEQEDLGGAFAFATAVVQESQNLLVSGDLQLFEAMSSETCTFCAATLDYFGELEHAGHTFIGGQIDVLDGMPQGGLQSDGTWHLEFAIEVDPATVLDESGNVIEETPLESYIVAVALERVGDGWRVIDVGSERT